MRGSTTATVGSADDVEQIAYSVTRAARLLDLSERKLWQLVKDGEIASYRVGTARRISRVALLEFVERQEAAA